MIPIIRRVASATSSFFANPDKLAQVSPFDKLHHQEMALARRNHIVDRHDVRMAQGAAYAAFANELTCLGRVFAIAIAQHLECHDLAGLTMHGAIHACKRPASHKIEDFVITRKRNLNDRL